MVTVYRRETSCVTYISKAETRLCEEATANQRLHHEQPGKSLFFWFHMYEKYHPRVFSLCPKTNYSDHQAFFGPSFFSCSLARNPYVLRSPRLVWWIRIVSTIPLLYKHNIWNHSMFEGETHYKRMLFHLKQDHQFAHFSGSWFLHVPSGRPLILNATFLAFCAQGILFQSFPTTFCHVSCLTF